MKRLERVVNVTIFTVLSCYHASFIRYHRETPRARNLFLFIRTQRSRLHFTPALLKYRFFFARRRTHVRV